MPNRAESISQRQLVFELKHAIDVCQRRPGDSRAAAHLSQLIELNPRGMDSRHVMHNIGQGRRAWLAGWFTRAGAASPISPDGHSFGPTR